MTEQEQIEQMARTTCQMYCRQYEKRCAGVGECDYKCLHYQRCEALYAAGYHRQEWISVEDRLPEKETPIKWRERTGYNSVRVLCACKQKSGKILVKEGYCEMWGDNYGPYWKIPGSIDSVTHWMPLPTPPTEKEN